MDLRLILSNRRYHETNLIARLARNTTPVNIPIATVKEVWQYFLLIRSVFKCLNNFWYLSERSSTSQRISIPESNRYGNGQG